MNGVQAWVAHALRAQGVKTSWLPFIWVAQVCLVYDALYDGGGRHLLCRHEQGCRNGGNRYRVSGRAGCLRIATSGPGAATDHCGWRMRLLDSVPASSRYHEGRALDVAVRSGGWMC